MATSVIAPHKQTVIPQGIKDEREVVVCGRKGCKLVQFRTKNGLCRKCFQSLDPIKADKPAIPVQLKITSPLPAPTPIDHEMLQKSISATVRSLRLQRNLSQLNLAKRIPCARSYITKLERGRVLPSIETCIKLAKALDVQIEFFFVSLSDFGARALEVRSKYFNKFLSEFLLLDLEQRERSS